MTKAIFFSFILLIFFGCGPSVQDDFNEDKKSEKEDFIYGKDVTGKDVINLNESFVIKSTLSNLNFLSDAKTKGYGGLIEGKLKNKSNENIDMTIVDQWISNDTLYHEIYLKAISDHQSDSINFDYEISIHVDVDDRNYYNKVDTIFPYINHLKIRR